MKEIKEPNKIAGIIFDVDGCVARGNRVLPGVPEMLAKIRAHGIRYAFLTNANARTRAEVTADLNAMGIPATVDDVLTSATIVAETACALYPGKKILAAGSEALSKAFRDRGVTPLDWDHSAEAEVVVMGKDPDFTQRKLDLICQAIWNGAEFMATNYDAKVPVEKGFLPGTGATVKAVAYATGKEPLVTGKPSKWAGEMAMRVLGIAPERGIVVGDQLEQDIRMGREAGLFSVLVLSGATTEEAASAAPPHLKPDLILPDVTHLVEWLDRAIAVERMDRESPYVLWFEKYTPDAVSRIGGKNASLGEMIRASIPVPPGFAVTTDCYKTLLNNNGLKEKIDSLLARVNTQNVHEMEEISVELRSRIENTRMPAEIESTIRLAYSALCDRVDVPAVPVAVRSSATAEDLPGASFAGQQDTFLWISGADNVVRHVAKCWSSLFTARAIAYRVEMGFPHDKIYMSVGVQLMVQPKAAGVAFTLNPTNGDRSKVCIDASWGFGEAVVGGEVTPDNYLVDKVTFEIVRKTISPKQIEYALDPETNTVVKRDVLPELQNAVCLDDEEIKAVARMARQAEKHYGRPQDVEWAIDANLPAPDNVVLLQSRPETVWSRKAPASGTANRQTGVAGVLATLLTPVRIKQPGADSGSTQPQ
ncbi:MAG: HAD-IIA family hydrolase [Chloroflexi bacterium]|nr:HAD-IIA family hydrolase [Chloroflexota bacterium]